MRIYSEFSFIHSPLFMHFFTFSLLHLQSHSPGSPFIHFTRFFCSLFTAHCSLCSLCSKSHSRKKSPQLCVQSQESKQLDRFYFCMRMCFKSPKTKPDRKGPLST